MYLPLLDAVSGVQGDQPAAHAQDIVVGPRLGGLPPHQLGEVVHVLGVTSALLPATCSPCLELTKPEGVRKALG